MDIVIDESQDEPIAANTNSPITLRTLNTWWRLHRNRIEAVQMLIGLKSARVTIAHMVEAKYPDEV